MCSLLALVPVEAHQGAGPSSAPSTEPWPVFSTAWVSTPVSEWPPGLLETQAVCLPAALKHSCHARLRL